MLSVFDVFVVVVGSYALLKVLRTVGETALSVSRRNEAPLPKMRGWWVLTVSLGRCDGREGIIGSEVAMVDCSAGDDEKVGGAGCDDIVESIMGETCRTREPGGRRQRQCGGDVSLLWPGALAVSAGGHEVEVLSGARGVGLEITFYFNGTFVGGVYQG